MFANFLIGLREGLEAALVVGILVAYLVKTGHREQLRAVWAGVGAALGLSLAVGAVLTFTSRSLSFEAQEMFGGVTSIVAVGFVTVMVFWMRAAARTIRADMESRLGGALAVGTAAVAGTALLAVGREGLETAVFLWAAVQATGSTTDPLAGAALGLAAAVALGWGIYRRSVRLDLRRFFTWTGALLVLVAGGVLSYGVHDLQEARILPGLTSLAFDVSEQVPPTSWYGTLLKGTLNVSPATTWLELAAWLLYVVPVMTLFLRPHRRTPAPASRPAEPAAVR